MLKCSQTEGLESNESQSNVSDPHTCCYDAKLSEELIQGEKSHNS